ncbi:MAG: hypothetical protein R3F61_00840 [Myxococcota bacterium]
MLLVTLAFAEQAAAPADCAIAALSESIPADGATGVPVDIAPLLVFRGSCGVAAPYNLRVYLASDPITPVHEDVYDFAAFEPAGESWLLEADFGTLLPDTAYDIEMESEWGERVLLGFTTGSGTIDPVVGGVPGITLDYASQVAHGGGLYTTEVEVTVTSVGSGDGVYRIREDGFDRAVVLASGASDTVSLSWSSFEKQKEICVSVIERDGAGSWFGPSELSCVSVERSSGCSHTAPWLAGWLIVPLLGLRRRASGRRVS